MYVKISGGSCCVDFMTTKSIHGDQEEVVVVWRIGRRGGCRGRIEVRGLEEGDMEEEVFE